MQLLFDSILFAALVAGGFSLIVAMLLVKTKKWHGHHSMDSVVGVQKFHTHPTPRVGGIAIVIGAVVAYFLLDEDKKSILGPLLLAAIPAFVFGILEDITKCVSALTRLIATMCSGFLGWILTSYSITNTNIWGFDFFLSFTFFSVTFTSFAVSGIANAFNIIDGFNGLSSGVSLIILSAFAVLLNSLGDKNLATICLVLASSIVGFILINWPFGKLFLGDGGAYFIGFSLAWISVILLQRHVHVSAWAPMLMCGFPVLEVVFSMLRRRRRHLSLAAPDRLHLHSLVNRRLMSRWLPKASKLTRNSSTGAFMCLLAMLPVSIAFQWPTQTPILVFGFFFCAVLYLAVYARLTQFRWCLSSITLIPKSV
jgi:UDP-N-acetylmuramyl pentapeptide phosphotransferase/UDP-N-acetylglucosamine-1-phosphate transferase